MSSNVASGPHDPANLKPVYVFEAPVRVWHWVHTFSFLVLAATGYLIANPLSSVGGEASDHFFMGNIRLIHFISAYVFAIGFVVRIYWALVGNRYAREMFYLPLWRAEWWENLWYEIRFYTFFERRQHKTPGHNALAQTGMFFLNTLMTIFMIVTGFALYGEGLGAGSWADTWFGWVIPMLGGGEATHNWHGMAMWIMFAFMFIHIYMAIRADMVGRQSSVSAIISGWRLFKDDQP